MLTAESSFEIETCSYCQLRREIIAIKFPLYRPATALFVCPSCGSACAEPNRSKNKRPGRLRLRNISLPVPQEQPNAPVLVTDSGSQVTAGLAEIINEFQDAPTKYRDEDEDGNTRGGIDHCSPLLAGDVPHAVKLPSLMNVPVSAFRQVGGSAVGAGLPLTCPEPDCLTVADAEAKQL
jgi:hypothetical protein